MYHAEKGITQGGITQRGNTRKGITKRDITQRRNTRKGITQRGNTQKGSTQRGITEKGITKFAQKGNLQKGHHVRSLLRIRAWILNSIICTQGRQTEILFERDIPSRSLREVLIQYLRRALADILEQVQNRIDSDCISFRLENVLAWYRYLKGVQPDSVTRKPFLAYQQPF